MPEKTDPIAEWASSEERKSLVSEVVSILEDSYIKKESIDKALKMLDSLGFYDSPASSTHHNNFFGGLAKHSIHVAKILESLSDKYPEFNVSSSSAQKAGLFHDVCKCKTYVINKNKDGSVSKKAFKVEDDYPIGFHGDKSVYILLEHKIPLTWEEKLMIRYHMGKFDSMSPMFEKVRKKYPQVGIMSIADQLATLLEDLESPEDSEDES